MKPKLSPGEIVRRLQMIEGLTAEGLSVAEALRSVGVRQVEYDRWRVEYYSLGRMLGPLRRATPELVTRTRRTTPAHPRKTPR
jgi:putative transposase